MVFPKRNSDFQSPNPEVPGGSHAHFDWLIKSRDPRGHSEDVGDDGGAAIPRRAGVSIEEWDRMPTKK